MESQVLRASNNILNKIGITSGLLIISESVLYTKTGSFSSLKKLCMVEDIVSIIEVEEEKLKDYSLIRKLSIFTLIASILTSMYPILTGPNFLDFITHILIGIVLYGGISIIIYTFAAKTNYVDGKNYLVKINFTDGDGITESGKMIIALTNKDYNILSTKSINQKQPNDNKNAAKELENSKSQDNASQSSSLHFEIMNYSELYKNGVLSEKEFNEIKEILINKFRSE